MPARRTIPTTALIAFAIALALAACGKHPKPAATVTADPCSVQGPAYAVPAPGRIVPAASAAAGAP